MSFSYKVKEEVIGHVGNVRHCRIAELSAMLLYGAQFELFQTKTIQIRFETEHLNIANKFKYLLKDIVSYEGEILERKTNKQSLYGMSIDHPPVIVKLMNVTGLKINAEGQMLINQLVVQSACCKRAFLRGAFICSGSLSDPEKTYHLEVISDQELHAGVLQILLKYFEIDAKITTRKKYFVVYIKEGTQIVEFLNIIEAHLSLMDLENVRILKEMRNNVNRIVNCETANLNKTVSASYHQVESIEYIMDTVGLEYLPDGLKEIAELRIQNPSMSLKELGNSLSTPVGKSGVNHRLRKIIEIAEELRSKRED